MGIHGGCFHCFADVAEQPSQPAVFEILPKENQSDERLRLRHGRLPSWLSYFIEDDTVLSVKNVLKIAICFVPDSGAPSQYA